MIIKGCSRSGGAALGTYLTQSAKNERATVLEVRGTIADDPRGALIEMEAFGVGTNCTKPIYHGIASPAPPYQLTREQWLESADAIEKKLGLEGQPRVIVLHQHEGREHMHIAWARVDLDTLTAIPDSFNYRKHEEVARDLERRFGHDRVQGAHAERGGPDGKVQRPERTPLQSELRQEERTGIKGKDVTAEVTAAFRSADGPDAFKAALEEKGYVLSRGDRRDFVIVDPEGGSHSLARRIEGVRAVELRDFMEPIDRNALPSAEEAHELQIERAQDRLIEWEADPLSWEDRLADAAIAAAEMQGKTDAAAPPPAAVPKAELFDRDAANQAWEERVAAGGIEAAELRDQALAEQKADYTRLGAAARADNATARDMESTAFWRDYASRRDAAVLARVEAWRDFAEGQRAIGDREADQGAGGSGLRVFDAATDAVCGLADFVCDFLTGGSPAPPRNDADRLIAERRANAALERIERQIEHGQALRADDVRDLTPGQLERLREKGDTYMYEIVWRIERERARADEYGRERER